MPRNLQQQTQKQAEEAKSCMKVQNGKAVENNKENVMKSQGEQENKNWYNFVILSKRKTFEKLGGKMFKNIEQYGNKGFNFYCYFILMVLFCIFHGIYDLDKTKYLRFSNR